MKDIRILLFLIEYYTSKEILLGIYSLQKPIALKLLEQKIYIYIYILSQKHMAHFPDAVDYAECISAQG